MSNFAHEVISALPEMRQMAESRMLDVFDISVPTGAWHFDKDAGEDVETLELLFTTPGRVKAASGLVAREAEVGGRTSVTITRELHIPVNSPTVPAGAVAVCTFVHPSSDPTLLGATLRLEGPSPGSQTTARRLEVSEVIQ